MGKATDKQVSKQNYSQKIIIIKVSANFHLFSSLTKLRVPPAAALKTLNEAIAFVVVLPNALSSTL